jgi:hypothetical protein
MQMGRFSDPATLQMHARGHAWNTDRSPVAITGLTRLRLGSLGEQQ